ncbi:type II/IV secretion system ATPase subunit [Tessaracoccus rhinocerotis]|uniref:Type II/IV secretion system ATPase subunit n=1 Tax=Tessaracoccus rhinocerotis TaxID=1689449 RepID=A0A553JWS4_9ACTN|nr:CpaF/VirB11 family protein [Tessaracoccus rhinocerotis]TRY16909.1 type II/IV secretion system ATPase subunit [Tessaracoccus rhinocerotis]
MSSPVSRVPSLGGAFNSLAASDWHPDPPARRRGHDAPEPRSAVPPSLDVDWPLVVVLRRHAAERISQISEQWQEERHTPIPEEDRRVRGRAVIRSVVHAHAEQLTETGEALWPMELEDRYAAAVENAIFGYGRMQPLFEIPEAENIEIHGWDSVMVQYGDGHREPHAPVADTDEELVDAIRFLGETASPPRPFDDAHPTMTLALGDRFRLHAIGFGLSYRPSIIIRQHILTDVTLPDLAEDGMLPAQVAHLLHAAVLARKSIVISGDQGAGKTTLLRALIAAIHPTERFGTLETDYELLTHLRHDRRNMLALQAKVGLGENSSGREVGSWSVADLIPEALRQNLSRLVVGEVRGAEAGAMFEAMQAGAGTLSTTHSHSATATIDRLAARVAQGGVIGMEEALRQVAHNINFIVHVVLEDNAWRGGTRRRLVSEVRQLTGSIEGGRPSTHLVYRAATSGAGQLFQPEASMAAELEPFQAGVTWNR